MKNLLVKLAKLFVVIAFPFCSASAEKLEILGGSGTVSVFDSTTTPDAPSVQLFVNQPGLTLPQGGVELETVALTGTIPGAGIHAGVTDGSLFWKVDDGATGVARINLVGPQGNWFPFIVTEIGGELEIRGHASRYIAPGELYWFFSPTFSFSAGIQQGDFVIREIFGNNRANGDGFNRLETSANFQSPVELTVSSIVVTTPVPEVSTWVMFGAGIVLLVFLRRQHKV